MTPVAVDVAPDLALVTTEDQAVLIRKHFEFTHAGLRVKGRPSLEICGALVESLKKMNSGIQFAIGDAINYAESMFGEEASQIIDAEGWSEETVRNYAWVASRVAPENRQMPELTFSHHQEVAGQEPSQQKMWLARALEGDGGVVWSTKRLSKELKQALSTAAAAAPKYTVTIACEDPADVDALCRQLENLGRTTYTKHLPKEV